MELLGPDNDTDKQLEDPDNESSESESSGEPPKKYARRAETPVLRQVQKKRSIKKLPVRLDPTAYHNLDLGTDGPPAWWVEADLANDQPTYDRGRRELTECFQKRIDQAKQYKYSEYDARHCPFTQGVLQVLQSKAWSAEKLANVFLSGMCPYRQWLMGQGRPPTSAELHDIPRATSEQLAMFGVYTDLITRQGREYMYTGSGTAQHGVGARWRSGYEAPISRVRQGKAPAPSFRESHLSVLLQPDATASIRLRASWDPRTITPTLVVMMEAALMDFDDTISDSVPEDVPLAERNQNYIPWSLTQSREYIDASRAAYPSGRLRSSSAIGLNRASSYKQGARVGIRKHRCHVLDALNGICPCCAKKPTQESAKKGRLSVESSFPLPGIPYICMNCNKVWRKSGQKSMDAARVFLVRRRNGHKFEYGQNSEDAARPWYRDKDQPSDQQIQLQQQQLALAQQPGGQQPTRKRERTDGGQCFACKYVDHALWTGYLSSHPEERLCDKCRKSHVVNNVHIFPQNEAKWLVQRSTSKAAKRV